MGVPVLKWLASKRNDLGGYSSTQNTVIAIQALSQVASLLSNTKQDITLTVQSDDFSESINIVSENAQVFNRFDLPTTNKTPLKPMVPVWESYRCRCATML